MHTAYASSIMFILDVRILEVCFLPFHLYHTSVKTQGKIDTESVIHEIHEHFLSKDDVCPFF
ncbi:hypothetical protein HMPREF0083_06191 [Aneurinibacillus aneurinilyticus ATCC 12856]|uniref:Uncharacterized protein n=1 Tax=Aneurinibacillus aneurinilyticus ATCC 12856 TaxID=649747 RepID=U1WP43_ANEAE|nr:hypothetical protein HMPREF0083_06191 [Aneurinibacillus aneurinilyticus ATCC 12856]